uniref:CR-type domain-containing protein n=1 Tax=Chlamydomonas leiostraca TaxID=1034604 RepID=A0A7S0X014_9CHLO|mmetsp:Transcript_36538/g.92276  ORF Transcript_36538/g.92276 Transcript_36538/m.92276 type:complete len:176 (+) Transcript_36538:124-651(+)
MLSTTLHPLQSRKTCIGVRVKHARCRSLVVAWARDTEVSKTAHGQALVPAPIEQATELPEKSRTVIDVLLNRAASNLTRGAATCANCKGTGACSCPSCQGHGIVKPQQARMNVMRHAVQKFKMLLGVPRAAYSVDWLQTNRCRRCHGQGNVLCDICNGAGIRHPVVGRQLIKLQK